MIIHDRRGIGSLMSPDGLLDSQTFKLQLSYYVCDNSAFKLNSHALIMTNTMILMADNHCFYGTISIVCIHGVTCQGRV